MAEMTETHIYAEELNRRNGQGKNDGKNTVPNNRIGILILSFTLKLKLILRIFLVALFNARYKGDQQKLRYEPEKNHIESFRLKDSKLSAREIDSNLRDVTSTENKEMIKSEIQQTHASFRSQFKYFINYLIILSYCVSLQHILSRTSKKFIVPPNDIILYSRESYQV